MIETYKKNTLGGVEIEFKKWITGFDKRKLNIVLLGSQDIRIGEQSSDGQTSQFIKGDKIVEYQDELIRVYVVSVNGKTENVFDEVMNLNGSDYDFIMEEINNIGKDNASLEKK